MRRRPELRKALKAARRIKDEDYMLGILASLGHVLYWLGCIATPITFVIVTGMALGGRNSGSVAAAVGVICAVPVFLAGVAWRYVFSGPKQRANHQDTPPR